MSDATEEIDKSSWKRLTLTPIKEGDDGSNNYNEFRRKSTLELDAMGYWKFIDGPEYDPPKIPELQPSTRVEGVDDTGNKVSIRLPGNEILVQAAKDDAKAWLDGDKKTLSAIVKAVPVQKLYVVDGCTTAHAAWFALKNEYEPANSLAAIGIKQQIIGNRCIEGDDPVNWLRVMIQLYGRLRDADPTMMPDTEFARHLATLMTGDVNWRYCRDDLRRLMKEAEAAGKPYSSRQVIQHLREEEIEMGIAPSVVSINAIVATGKGKGRERAVPGVYSAGQQFTPQGNSKHQSQRNDRKQKPYPGGNNRSNPKLICDNTHCAFPVGHTKAECFVYGGGKAGQYPPNFRGQRDIHLSPEARVAARRKQAIEKANGNVATAKMVEEVDGDPSRHAVSANYGQATEEEVEEILGQVEGSFAFMMEVEGDVGDDDDGIKFDEVVNVNAVALNTDIPPEDSVNHDTGATRHIFRERKFFHDYADLDTPLSVHGFGSKLSAVAIGKGSIVLKASVGNSTRTFSLSNVLHIPSARCNLISGSRLDRKGVSTRTGDGKITYLNEKKVPFTLGSIVRELYKMDVVLVQAPDSDPKKSSTSSQSAMMAGMVPDVTRLFGPGSDSELAKRVGFTTV